MDRENGRADRTEGDEGLEGRTAYFAAWANALM